MDNDNKVKKALVKIYRGIRLKVDYIGMNLLDENKGNELIIKSIQENKPFMVGRFGAVEMHCVSRWMRGEKCTDYEKEQAMYAAGIFPNDDQTIDAFCSVYIEAMRSCDILGVWEVTDEKRAIQEYCKAATLIPSRAIEPYYFERPWSSFLRNKRVLVVHPFIESIEKQIQKRELIWPGKEVLPEFEDVSFVKAVQSNAGGETSFTDWFDALDYMKEEISKKKFDIALVGAGAYGLPLSAYIKNMGKQVVQMSGATQILFGVKGKRWDEHPVISKFYNDAWIRPSIKETPPVTHKVEGGSYW